MSQVKVCGNVPNDPHSYLGRCDNNGGNPGYLVQASVDDDRCGPNGNIEADEELCG